MPLVAVFFLVRSLFFLAKALMFYILYIDTWGLGCIFSILCPCSTGRRPHGAHSVYKNMNRYAVRSLRWFGGTSPALLLCMCCVSTADQGHMGDAHAAHFAHEWWCHCIWCRVWEPDHYVSTPQVVYAQRTSHVCAAIIAILWRMTGMCTVHGLHTCRTNKCISYITLANVWAVNVTFKCPVHNLKVQLNFSNLI